MDRKSMAFLNESKNGIRYITIYLTDNDINLAERDKFGRKRFLIFTRFNQMTGEKYYKVVPSKPRGEKQDSQSANNKQAAPASKKDLPL